MADTNHHEKHGGGQPQITENKLHYPWHRHLISLYGTMLELFGSACTLIRDGRATGINILLRSALEANVDFENLVDDRKYGYYLLASEAHEWIKVLKEAKGGHNPFLQGISGEPSLDAMIAMNKAELDRLEKLGYKPLSISQKFERAKMKEVYTSVYNFLCCDSHNNIRALNSRHINISQDETDFDIEFFAPLDIDRLLPDIDFFCGIVAVSTVKIHKALQSDAVERCESLLEEMGNIRKRLTEVDQDNKE